MNEKRTKNIDFVMNRVYHIIIMSIKECELCKMLVETRKHHLIPPF